MKKNTSSKCLVTFIVLLLICTSFISASGGFIADNQIILNIPNEKRTGLKDIIFDLKMSILIKIALYPSLSACIINDDEVT